ncbi:Hypothetical predicted protein [Mytilus galloprovincialis]|uniref:Uncharacterized protein n=1 Tax=Mytilus galloprovincialis TaxID=29158 RepID=A0A8B6EX45_MYTGA|nr:Hypothetical predicted protein [Mytilus galloprovincialis]
MATPPHDYQLSPLSLPPVCMATPPHDYQLSPLLCHCLQNELRRVYDEYVAEMSNDIEKSIDVDQRLAWCIINSRRSRNTSDILLKLNNKLVNDPESVCAEFANLFEAIAKMSDHTEDKVNNKLLNLIRNRCDNDPIRPVFF